MNKKYNLKLDLQFRCNNSIMKFNQFDNNTSDFFMRITNGGNLVDIEKAIVVLAVIKPSGKVDSQFVEVENGLVYADLKPNMRDEIGIYTAQAMLILEDERVVTDAISYEVEEDKIFSLLNDTVEATEEFTVLTDMLSRLSTIEISEEQRVINEAERILSEENRKTEEAKRVEAELIRQHEEADRAKYDATRESNENIRKQNESIRLADEVTRKEEEAKRAEEENKRILAEEERNANYNFMTEDEERRRLEANTHKEAEVLRVQAETDRVNEEAKRRTTEQSRVLAENTRVSNENTRIANEKTRQNKEAERVEAETQRQNRYNSFISDAEANANNFENYTNTAKVKEEERKANELDRKSQEDRRVSNEVERISNENTRKANEVARIESEKQRANAENLRKEKIIEIQSDYDSLKKVIIDENASANLQNQINQTNSQLEHKASKNEIFSMANMGQDVKEAMTGGSVAVVGINGVLRENILNGAVTVEKTNFLEKKSNSLFCKDFVTPGVAIRIENGQTFELQGYNTSEFIEVKPNTTYITQKRTFRAEYDSSKTYITGYNTNSSTTTSSTKYIRFTIADEDLDTEYFVENGQIGDKYYSFDLKPYIGITKENLKENIVSVENCDFINTTYSENLFNPNTYTDNSYIQNNRIITNEGYFFSDYIEVEEGVTYVTSGSASFVDVYDESKNAIYTEATKSITIPSGGKYIRWTCQKSVCTYDKLMICKNKLPSSYIPFEIITKLDKSIKIDTSQILDFNSSIGYWEGKKMLAIGDSITEWSYADENGINVNWRNVVSAMTGLNITRCAKHGMRACDIASIMEYDGITEEDIATYDIVTISLGQNDRSNTLGTVDDIADLSDGATFCSNVKGLIEYIISLNSKCTLIWITPTPSSGREIRLRNQSELINEICKLYQMPCLDLNRLCNFNANNYSYFYVDSSVHPNGIGNKRMGRITANFINQL